MIWDLWSWNFQIPQMIFDLVTQLCMNSFDHCPQVKNRPSRQSAVLIPLMQSLSNRGQLIVEPLKRVILRQIQEAHSTGILKVMNKCLFLLMLYWYFYFKTRKGWCTTRRASLHNEVSLMHGGLKVSGRSAHKRVHCQDQLKTRVSVNKKAVSGHKMEQGHSLDMHS